MTHCKDMSIIMLERFLAQDIGLSEYQAVQKHISQCHICPAIVADFMRQKEIFEQTSKSRIWKAIDHSLSHEKISVFDNTIFKKFFQNPQSILVPAFAVLLVFTLFPFIYQSFEDNNDLIRIKGGNAPQMFSMNFLKKGKDNILRYGISEDIVTPKDIIQLSYSSAQDGYLMIVGILKDNDNVTHTEVYFPDIEKDDYENAFAEKVQFGKNINIPYALELDEILGDETIIGIYSPQPFQFEDIDFLFDAAKEEIDLSQPIFTSVIVLHKKIEL